MTPSEFLNNVKAGKIDRVYLFTGPETYRHAQCLGALSRALIPDDDFRLLNYSQHSGTTESLGALLGVANQLPMLSSHKVVSMRDFDKATDAEIDALKNYLRKPNPSTTLVFLAPNLDKRRTISTVLLKGCTTVDCPRLNDKEAGDWVQRTARERGYQFAPAALGQFVGLVGTDLHALSLELDKVTTYLGKSGTVTPQDVEAVTVRSREHGSFDLSDAILSGDAKLAIKLLHRLLDQGEEPVALVGLLAWLYRQMFTAHELMKSNAPRDEIVRELRMPPNRVNGFFTAIRRKSEDEIRRGIVRLAETDVALKSSRATPRLQMEILVCELVAGK